MGISGGRLEYRTGKRRITADFRESAETQDFSLKICETSVNGGKRFTAVLTPKAEISIINCVLLTDEKLTDDDPVFLNGYQTWTDSSELRLGQKIPGLSPLARPLIGMYGDYSFYRYGKDRLQSWSYTYIRDMKDGAITLYGSLSEKSGYTIFEYGRKEENLRIIKDCKGLELSGGAPYVLFDLFMIHSEEEAAFDGWFAASRIPKPRVGPCTGWTSWYNYYTAVTESDVLENLRAFSSRGLPIDYFQIDDGYQEAVGDWLRVNGKFPGGMACLADEIHDAGYRAGLWLAPIICEKKSELFRRHPDWVMCRAGFNPGWSGIFYALDFYNPEVRAYLREVFDTVLNKWNYDMVKLDFLYAASLPKRKDKTRGQVMCEFFEFLREISGGKIILGCGAPLGAAFGLFDYCRIGSDVALKWEDSFLSAIRYRERVSTFNALTSTVGRWRLNGKAFYSDPDVFILRDCGNSLTEDEKYTLYMINSVLGGLIFTSDNINEYTDSQMELLKALLSPESRKIIKVVKSEAVSIYYEQGGSSFCLFSNLNHYKINVWVPYDGVMQKESLAVSEKDKIELRPHQTVCLRRE
ncbi:MAG: glycoside hydrolase family 36 protein [Oscillospiraceae bacterium]|nr:glycoside hydrolase family 36 protein [Oscillospiraceae bacterium]